MDERPTLTFMLCGLCDRDATLFRSFVRLVDHRTRHRWEWRQSSADLVVMHDGLREVPSHRLTLRVGRQPQDGRHASDHLGLPLRADALEDCLNALGMRALAMRQTVHGSAPAATPATPSVPDPAQVPDMLVQLLRWPPQQLLTGAHHIRLATLMTGHPTTLRVLCQRSNLAPEVCAAFLNRLDAAGLLRWTATASHAGSLQRHAAPPQPGVLERIRRRLAQLTRAPSA
ncbi:Uncharacterised protein [Delftia tsuruhatensis]|uniref:hypothetical protein n=1 Tax=Delftia tsuruhatensis TaxID=180282 RepID=UPI001E769503|nr:hypothetical protein [Delftia tsuruhatensis]CAB5700062.1 Uncharacterised protein [Delftia tsuruhatensis]CAC9693578.1 Uncharacterised protein [Delftia tsuruhatensis]